MVERHHEVLIVGVEQIEQEPLDRGAGVLDAPAEHAVARVEEHAQTDRHPFARELRDGLWLAVFEEFERLARQPAHQPSVGVAYGRVDAGELDAGTIEVRVAEDLALRQQRGARRGGQHEQRRAESKRILHSGPIAVRAVW